MTSPKSKWRLPSALSLRLPLLPWELLGPALRRWGVARMDGAGLLCLVPFFPLFPPFFFFLLFPPWGSSCLLSHGSPSLPALLKEKLQSPPLHGAACTFDHSFPSRSPTLKLFSFLDMIIVLSVFYIERQLSTT